jgi:hypothetical protein
MSPLQIRNNNSNQHTSGTHSVCMFLIITTIIIIIIAGHVARMGEERKVYKVLVGKPEGKNHWKDQGVGEKMGSEWILGRLAWGVWIGFDWVSTGTGGGLL